MLEVCSPALTGGGPLPPAAKGTHLSTPGRRHRPPTSDGLSVPSVKITTQAGHPKSKEIRMSSDELHRRPEPDDEIAVNEAERILRDALDDLRRRTAPDRAADLSWRTNRVEL